MALKTPIEKAPPVPVDDTVLLELAMYTHYTWGGITYESGTAYKFKQEDAMTLLAEQDYGRQVWRQYRPARPKVAPRTPVVDSTEVKAVRRETLEAAALGKRIEVGADDEITDILNRPDQDTSGDVTV